jgi:hypothetical protein
MVMTTNNTKVTSLRDSETQRYFGVLWVAASLRRCGRVDIMRLLISPA